MHDPGEPNRPAPDGEADPGSAPKGAGPDRRRTPRKRLVVEVSEDLHRRIVSICATRGIPLNQAAREALERAFPGA